MFFVAGRLQQSLLLELTVAILVEMVRRGIVVYLILHLLPFILDLSRKRPLDEGKADLYFSQNTIIAIFQAMMVL